MAQAGHSGTQLGINGYRPRGPFVDFHNRKQRWAILVCHRRAGKTVGCIAELVLSALFTRKQDARYAYVAPQYNQAKDIAWAYVKQLTADIPGITYNESELRADFPNGARVRLYGADNPDRLRGLYMDGVVLDEFADMRSSVWGEIIRPLLADRKGWAVFIGTPKGHNEFYAKWQEARANDADWFAMILRASESGLIDQKELADAAKGMSEDQYAQEFECSFEAAVVGAYYGRLMNQLEQEGRIGVVPYQDDFAVYTAWDIGYSDDTSVWFFQVMSGEVRVIDYYAANGHGVDHYCDMLDRKAYNYHRVGGKPLIYLPHDARAKTFAAQGKSAQEQFFARGYASQIVPSLSLQDGIQAVRQMLPRTVFDREKCAEGIESLKLYQREWDSDKKCFRENPRHDWTSHGADAARMMAVMWKEKSAPLTPEAPKFDTDRTIDEIIRRQRDRRRAEESF